MYAIAPPPVHLSSRLSWNYCAYLILSLRVGCSSQYAQMIFWLWKKKSFFYAAFQFSFTWDHMTVKITKGYSSHKLTPAFSQTFAKCLYPISSQIHFFGFLKFWYLKFFFFSFTWDHLAGELKKSAPFHKSPPNVFKLLSTTFSQSCFFRFLIFLYFPYFIKPWNLIWESMGNHKMWNIWKTANRRVKRMKIWDWQS